MYLRSLAWSPTIALSWLWGLGFFYSIHVSFTYGLAGFLAFAIPNALGLALFGIAVDRLAPPGDLTPFFTRVSSGYTGVFLGYQALAVGLTIFAFVSALLIPFFGSFGPALAAAIVLGGMACGHMVGIGGLKRLHVVLVVVGAFAASACLIDLGHSDAPAILRDHGPRFLGLVVPTILGFLLGPWLDVQHWQRAAEIRSEKGSILIAYVGGGTLFMVLICINGMMGLSVPASASNFINVNFGGIQDATRVVAGELLSRETAGWSPVLLFTVWGIIAMWSTVDSSYSATRWYMNLVVATSNNPLLAFIPKSLLTTPLWMLAVACGIAVASIRVNTSLLDLVAPYATLFLGYAACLAARSAGVTRPTDTMACLLIGTFSLAIFGIAYYIGDTFFMNSASLIPMLAVIPTLIRHRRKVTGFVSEDIAQVAPVAPPKSELVPFKGNAMTGEISSGGRGHFDGTWFNFALVPTYDDTNAVGNVYFANYIRWVGKAREMFFSQCLPEFKLETTDFFILTRDIFHQYVRETLAFDDVTIRLKIGKYNRKFATLEHEIRNAKGEVVGKGNQQLMFVDSKNYKLVDIPASILVAFLPYTPRSEIAAQL